MSLKKIAEMVGTSPSTVSRVLNNNYATCASEELKTRIWEAAHQIHYIPNSSARNLQSGQGGAERSLHLLVVLARVKTLEQDPFFRDLYRNLEIETFKKGFTMDCMVLKNEQPEGDFAHYDGMIILGRCSSVLLGALSRHTKNLVGIWRNPMNFEIDEIVCDGQKAAQAAVSYLIQNGHQKIGYIGDCSYESRYVGYCETLIRSRISMDYSCIVSTDQSKEQGFEAMQQLLADRDLTAVLCANDITAIGALEALMSLRRQKKWRDRKISVISIDDIEDAQSTTPMLTTVHIPKEAMAHMAVQILHDRILHGHTEKLRVEFPCHIVERESCYPVG